MYLKVICDRKENLNFKHKKEIYELYFEYTLKFEDINFLDWYSKFIDGDIIQTKVDTMLDDKKLVEDTLSEYIVNLNNEMEKDIIDCERIRFLENRIQFLKQALIRRQY